MQVRERLDAFTRGRSFKELLLRHTSNHSRGWRCINVSRGITSPDVSISGSQLFIGRAPVSMPSVLSSVIDQLLLLAIQVKTFWEIILEIKCYIIIKKKGEKGNGVVEKRRDNSNEILNRLCAILYLQRRIRIYSFPRSNWGETVFKCFSSNLQRWGGCWKTSVIAR